MKEPFISIVIPTYNSENTIQKTLESVFQQTFDNFEVIVSDDGSIDKTTEIVKEVFAKNSDYKTTFFSNLHKGPGHARNKGIMVARGEWVAFLDADDFWYPNKMSILVQHIHQNQDKNLWCHSEIIRQGEKEQPFFYYKSFDKKIHPFLSLYRKNTLSTSAVVVQRSALIKAGMFSESLPSAQDYDLWLRLALFVKIGYISEPLGVYLTRKTSISAKPIPRLECLLKISARNHAALKKITPLWLWEESRFLARAFTSSGLVLCSQKRYFLGLVYILRGFIYWPFQKELFLIFLVKLKAFYFNVSAVTGHYYRNM